MNNLGRIISIFIFSCILLIPVFHSVYTYCDSLVKDKQLLLQNNSYGEQVSQLNIDIEKLSETISTLESVLFSLSFFVLIIGLIYVIILLFIKRIVFIPYDLLELERIKDSLNKQLKIVQIKNEIDEIQKEIDLIKKELNN